MSTAPVVATTEGGDQVHAPELVARISDPTARRADRITAADVADAGAHLQTESATHESTMYSSS
jgi:hypothetical protein